MATIGPTTTTTTAAAAHDEGPDVLPSTKDGENASMTGAGETGTGTAVLSAEVEGVKSQSEAPPLEKKKNVGKDEKEGSMFTVLFFAAAATFTGEEQLRLPAPMTVAELFEELERRYPGVRGKVLSSAAVSVNLEYVDLEEEEEEEVREAVQGHKRNGEGGGGGEKGEGWGLVIVEGDEVGIIPPVSSG